MWTIPLSPKTIKLSFQLIHFSMKQYVKILGPLFPPTILTPLFSCYFYQRAEWAKPVNRLTSRCSFSHPRNQVSLTAPPDLPSVLSYYILRLPRTVSLRVHMFTHALLWLCRHRLCPTSNPPKLSSKPTGHYQSSAFYKRLCPSVLFLPFPRAYLSVHVLFFQIA